MRRDRRGGACPARKRAFPAQGGSRLCAVLRAEPLRRSPQNGNRGKAEGDRSADRGVLSSQDPFRLALLGTSPRGGGEGLISLASLDSFPSRGSHKARKSRTAGDTADNGSFHTRTASKRKGNAAPCFPLWGKCPEGAIGVCRQRSPALPQLPFACRRRNLPAKRRGCGNSGPPLSAPGSAKPQSPLVKEGYKVSFFKN